jgi:hypothetical protein
MGVGKAPHMEGSTLIDEASFAGETSAR